MAKWLAVDDSHWDACVVVYDTEAMARLQIREWEQYEPDGTFYVARVIAEVSPVVQSVHA